MDHGPPILELLLEVCLKCSFMSGTGQGVRSLTSFTSDSLH